MSADGRHDSGLRIPFASRFRQLSPFASQRVEPSTAAHEAEAVVFALIRAMQSAGLDFERATWPEVVAAMEAQARREAAAGGRQQLFDCAHLFAWPRMRSEIEFIPGHLLEDGGAFDPALPTRTVDGARSSGRLMLTGVTEALILHQSSASHSLLTLRAMGVLLHGTPAGPGPLRIVMVDQTGERPAPQFVDVVRGVVGRPTRPRALL